MCILFAERLNDSRGDLVTRMTVDEHLLSHMMKHVISSTQKSKIQRVCTPSVLKFSILLLISDIPLSASWPQLRDVILVWRKGNVEKKLSLCYSIVCYYNGGGKVICVPVALPASTLVNTPAEGNQRFHLWTESLWIPVTKPGRTPPIMPTWAFKS